jgi:uracil-DNA glycosylase family 4
MGARLAALTQGNSASKARGSLPKKTPPRPVKIPPRPSQSVGPVKGGEMAQRAADLHTLREQIQAGLELPNLPGGPPVEWVFGHGNPGARLMFVADAPRAEDNELGLPFVGESGRLLSRMIHAMGLSRTDVYTTYLVPFYDPRTDPESLFDSCEGFFGNAVDIVQPEVIVVFGEAAARRLSGRSDAFPHLRGQWFEYRQIPLLPTFHPEVLQQMPQGKAHVWQDLKAVMRFLGLSMPSRS